MKENQFHSLPSEAAILSVMLSHPHVVIDELSDELNAGHFFSPIYQELFTLFCEMWEYGQPIDIITCHQRLVDMRRDKHLGSPGILSELLANASVPSNISGYVKIVRSKSVLRQIQNATIEIGKDLNDNGGDHLAVLDKAQQSMLAIGERNLDNQEAKSCVQVVNGFLEKVNEVATKKESNGLKTGWPKLDEYLIPYEEGSYNVVTARTSDGKTALALNLSSYWARFGVGVGIISIEMTSNKLMQRIFAYESGIAANKFLQPLSEEDNQKLLHAAERVKKWNIWIEDRGEITAQRLRRVARKMVRKHKCKVIVIDYLQLVSGDKKQRREEQVAEVSRAIKLAAKELNVPFVVLAQLNRDADKAEEPQLYHLRESAAIEQDADSVIMLYRGGNTANVRQIETKVKIAKQRDGIRDRIITLWFDAPYQRFREESYGEVVQI